jgi:phospholipid/cholesterol/gamma-HCH transport system substrate-binding protein
VSFLRRLPPSAFKFAIFALVCIVLLVGLAVKVGNLSLFSDRHSLNAQLADVTGLASGDPVNIAGVPIGQVTSITVQHGHALIGMSVNNTVTLHRATDVGVRWQNVIGQKEIQIFPSGQGAILTAGSTIPLSHDVSDSSVNAFLNSLGPLLASINPQQANEFVENVSGALEGDTAEINQLINSGATIANTVGALDSQVGAVITNLDQVLTAISSRSGDLGTLIDNLQTVASSLASKNDLLDSVVSNLSGVASDLATLIGSNQSVLTSTIDNLKAVAGDVQNNQQHLASSLSSLGAGLAPYIQISNYGQWFAIQTIYTCLDNQTSCTYYEPADPPPGSGLLGGLPSSGADKTSSLGSALKQQSVRPVAATTIAGVLQAVSGQGAATTAPAAAPTATAPTATAPTPTAPTPTAPTAATKAGGS